MWARRIGVAVAALAALGVAVVLLLPRPPPVGPCLQVIDTEQVSTWRRVPVEVEVTAGRVPASRVCRATWKDARSPDRTVLVLALHRADRGAPDRSRPGAEVERLERGGTSVQVVRPTQGRALLVIALDDESWAEVTVSDEQQGDVLHWIDQVLAQRAVALAAIRAATATE
jgi:hypothetical protein